MLVCVSLHLPPSLSSYFLFPVYLAPPHLHSFPTRRSSDLFFYSWKIPSWFDIICYKNDKFLNSHFFPSSCMVIHTVVNRFIGYLKYVLNKMCTDWTMP